MISQTAEYALRAVVDLAYHHGKSRTTKQIATATKVPTGYLAKVLQDLNRQGIVESQRGLHGGMTLSRRPESITVFDVFQAVDPLRRIRSCPLGLAAHASQLCLLHQKLDDALATVERAFRSTTIADVTADPLVQSMRKRPTALTISPGLAATKSRRRLKKTGRHSSR